MVTLNFACVCRSYLDAILKQKKISEMATQQLLLDTYNVKTLLLQLHQLNPDSTNRTGPAPSGMYVKFVNAKVAHIEMVLKLVGTPEDMLLERFRIMWPEGSASDLQLLMALKATKKQDQQVILEMFGLSGKPGSSGKSASLSTATSTTNSPLPTTANSAASGYSAASAAASASAAAMASSMKSLTQDLSSSARNAVGNLKWSSGTKN